jgi:hypothetical protein
MTQGFIFWRQPLRAVGPCPPGEALADLQGMLAGRSGAFPIFGQRLVGSIRGLAQAPRVRLRRRGPLSAAGDVIEFRGTLRAEGQGSAFEGSPAYTFGSRLQFVSMLLAGVVLLVAGVVRELEGTARGSGVLLLGVVITAGAVVWIYSSSRTRDDQIRFIERHLESCLSGEGPERGTTDSTRSGTVA